MDCHVTTEIQTHTITNALCVIKQVTPPPAVITSELTND
jgi:hypothetical protein